MLALASKAPNTAVPGLQEYWVPNVPNSDAVNMVFWRRKQSACVNITIMFSYAGFNVSTWGTLAKGGNHDLWAESEIL